jgi:hypothetical protein
MTTAVQTPIQSEDRNLPLDWLVECPLNPRRIFDDAALNELADFVPGNKSGVLCRSPFCGRGRQKAHGSRRPRFQRVHNG